MTGDHFKTEFNEILKSTVSPFFKQLGFRRKGLNLTRQTNDISQCFNMQKNRWDDYFESVGFTFNLGFYNEEVMNLAFDQKITLEFPKTTDCFIQERFGMIVYQRDHWYELNKRIRTESVAAAVKNDLELHLAPLFEKYTSLNDLKSWPDDQNIFGLRPATKVAFLMITGEPEKAAQSLREAYIQALTPVKIYENKGGEAKIIGTFIREHFAKNLERIAQQFDVELSGNK